MKSYNLCSIGAVYLGRAFRNIEALREGASRLLANVNGCGRITRRWRNLFGNALPRSLYREGCCAGPQFVQCGCGTRRPGCLDMSRL